MANFLSRAMGSVGHALGVGSAEFIKAVRDTATGQLPPPPPGTAPAKGMLIDPYMANSGSVSYLYRPSNMSYEQIEMVSHRTAPIRICQKLIVEECVRYLQEAPDDFSKGLRLVPRDKSIKVTPAFEKEAHTIMRWLLCCGDPTTPSMGLTRVNLKGFGRLTLPDLVMYDQFNGQVVPRLNGKPYEMIAMPAATMRLKRLPTMALQNMWSGENHIPTESADDAKYVQVWNEIPIAEFTPRELMWGVRNPSTTLSSMGYGWSEVEDAVHLITAFNNAVKHNSNYHKNGTTAAGIAAFTGVAQAQKGVLDEFKNMWLQLATGVQNSWRTPLVTLGPGQDLKWIDIGGKTNRDMQFTDWMQFTTAMVAALFGKDVSEISGWFKSAGGGAIFQSQGDEKAKRSRDRSTRPVLECFIDQIDSRVVWPFNPDMRLDIVGLDPEDELDRIDKAVKKVTNFAFIDEVRADAKMKPLPDGKGEMILSQIWLQFAQQKDGQNAGLVDESGQPLRQDDPNDPNGGDQGDDANGGKDDAPDDRGGGKPAREPQADDPRRLAKALGPARMAAGAKWAEDKHIEAAALYKSLVERRPRALDVALGRAIVGAERGTPVEVARARQMGLHVETVEGVALFAKSVQDAQPAADFLRSGGCPDSTAFLRVLGSDPEVVADFDRLQQLRQDATRAAAPVRALVKRSPR